MSTYLGSMPEANYLVSDVPQYRIIMRHFHLQHRLHVHYIRSDECLKAVQERYPNYDELTCGCHLAQLADWGLIRLIPAQSKPANLLELRQRPRIYQAERTAIRLEQLRADLQAESEHAAAMHPTTLEQLVQQLSELVKWTATRVGHGYRGDYDETFQKWHVLRRKYCLPLSCSGIRESPGPSRRRLSCIGAGHQGHAPLCAGQPVGCTIGVLPISALMIRHQDSGGATAPSAYDRVLQ